MFKRVILCISLFVLSSVFTIAHCATIIFDDFSNPSTLTLNGNASVANSKLILTQAAGQISSAFYTNPLSFDDNGSFSTSFEFQTSVAYGIGYVFVLQNDSRGPNAYAQGGGGNLGYRTTNSSYPSINPSLGVAFISNTGSSNDRIAILMNGSVTPVYYQDISENYFHSAWNATTAIYAWIDYNGTTNQLEVRCSTNNSRPDNPLLTWYYYANGYRGLEAQFGGSPLLYAGFTSAESTAYRHYATQEILNWELRTSSVPIPGALWLLGSGLLGLVGIRRKMKD